MRHYFGRLGGWFEESISFHQLAVGEYHFAIAKYNCVAISLADRRISLAIRQIKRCVSNATFLTHHTLLCVVST